jgi:phosphoribosylformylglycinamidine synthase
LALLRRQFSSSEYAKVIHGIVAGAPPAIDLEAEERLIKVLVRLAASGVVRSAHDVSDGGLAVAVAECCFAAVGADLGVRPGGEGAHIGAPLLGAEVRFDGHLPAEMALFGEQGARAVVSVAAASLARVHEIAREYEIPARRIGQVTRDGRFRIHYNRARVEAEVASLGDIWEHALERALRGKA